MAIMYRAKALMLVPETNQHFPSRNHILKLVTVIYNFDCNFPWVYKDKDKKQP